MNKILEVQTENSEPEEQKKIQDMLEAHEEEQEFTADGNSADA